MVVERKISKEKYFIAALLAFLIFSLGLSLGIILDNARAKWAEKVTKEQEVNYASLQMQYLYLTTLIESNQSCSVMRIALGESVKELSKSLDKFAQYKADAKLNKDEFNLIGRKYILDNLRYWLFARTTKDKCDMDLVTILYFYSGNYCSQCPEQGTVLSYFKRKYEERLLIFPIDVDLEESEAMITILKGRYNITQYPSVIIEDKRYEGIVQKEELSGLICSSFKNRDLCLI